MEFLSVKLLDCNFATKRIHHRFFLENVPKSSCLKKNKNSFLRTKSIGNQRLNKAAALQSTTLNFIKKAEFMQDFPVEPYLKVLIYSQVNILGGDFFFTEAAGLEFIPTISLKMTPSQRFSDMGPARQLFLNYREIFCEILCKTFSNKVAGLYSIGYDFVENNVFDKNIQN